MIRARRAGGLIVGFNARGSFLAPLPYGREEKFLSLGWSTNCHPNNAAAS